MEKLNYLTEDELQQLIESVEEDTLMQAPGYLKDAILEKSIPKRIPRQHELLFFSAKIITAAAACIALLFILPDGQQADVTQPGVLVREEAYDDNGEDSFFRKFNQKANQFCSIINDGTNLIFQKEELK